MSEQQTRERKPPANLPAQLLTVADVCDVLRISRKVLGELRDKDRDFPKPFRMTIPKHDAKIQSGLRWSMGQIQRYVAKQDERAGNP